MDPEEEMGRGGVLPETPTGNTGGIGQTKHSRFPRALYDNL